MYSYYKHRFKDNVYFNGSAYYKIRGKQVNYENNKNRRYQKLKN